LNNSAELERIHQNLDVVGIDEELHQPILSDIDRYLIKPKTALSRRWKLSGKDFYLDSDIYGYITASESQLNSTDISMAAMKSLGYDIWTRRIVLPDEEPSIAYWAPGDQGNDIRDILYYSEFEIFGIIMMAGFYGSLDIENYDEISKLVFPDPEVAAIFPDEEDRWKFIHRLSMLSSLNCIAKHDFELEFNYVDRDPQIKFEWQEGMEVYHELREEGQRPIGLEELGGLAVRSIRNVLAANPELYRPAGYVSLPEAETKA